MSPLAPDMKLTWDDFAQFPEDGMRHEVIDGVHVVTLEFQDFRILGVQDFRNSGF